jgi:hypothetical protein
MPEIFRPINKKQELFLTNTKTREVLFGGAAGPGKTLCLVMFPLQFVHNPRFNGIIFRREERDAKEIIDRGIRYYGQFGAKFWISQRLFKFPSGAQIRVAGMKRESDYLSYKGFEFNFIGFDELVQFEEIQYVEMFHPLRSSTPSLPAIIRATTNPNPGACGHEWVKKRFLDPALPGTEFLDKTTGSTRLYIPSTVFDNPVLLKNNPDYVNNLKQMPEHRQRQLIYGDWEVAPDGAFTFSDYHISTETFESIAKNKDNYTFIMSFDWGYRDPFAALWFAYDKAKKVMILYKEIYGTDLAYIGKGLRLSSSQIAQKIIEAESEEQQHGIKITARIADPSIFSNLPKFRQKESSMQTTAISQDFERAGIYFTPGNNNRKQGFAAVQKALEVTKTYSKDGLLTNVNVNFQYLDKSCPHFIRTMKKLEFLRQGEDVRTHGTEDHLYDAFRYAVMFSYDKFSYNNIAKVVANRNRSSGKVL